MRVVEHFSRQLSRHQKSRKRVRERRRKEGINGSLREEHIVGINHEEEKTDRGAELVSLLQLSLFLLSVYIVAKPYG